MRIRFLGSSLNLSTGGGSNYTLDLAASELVRRGYDIKVLTLDPVTVPAGNRPYTIEQLSHTGGTRWSRRQAVVDAMRSLEGRTDVFHIFEPSLSLAGGRYRRTGGTVPVVATLNNYQVFCSNVDIMNETCHASCNIMRRAWHRHGSGTMGLASIPLLLYEQTFLWRDLQFVDMLMPDSQVAIDTYRRAGVPVGRFTIIPEMVDFHGFRAIAEGRDRCKRDVANSFKLLYAAV